MEIIDKIVLSSKPVHSKGVMWLNPQTGTLSHPSLSTPISGGGGIDVGSFKMAKTIEDGVLKSVMRSIDNSDDFQEMYFVVPKPGYIYTMPAQYYGLGEFILDDFYSIVFNIESLDVHSISNPDDEVPEDTISTIKSFILDSVLLQYQIGCTCLPLEKGKVCILSQGVFYGMLRKDSAEYIKKAILSEGDDFVSEYQIIIADEVPSKGELVDMHLKGVGAGEGDEYNVDIVLKCEDIHPVKEVIPLLYMFVDTSFINWVENDDPYFKYKGYLMGEEIFATNTFGKITMNYAAFGQDVYLETEIFSIEYLKKHLTNVGDGTFCILETDGSYAAPLSSSLVIWSPQPENIDDFQTLQTITRTDDLLIINTNYVHFDKLN